ncbi:MAG: GNAT family N-acetyltransferase [Ferruginibacter sp.]
MKLLPILEKPEDNYQYTTHPLCAETLGLTIEFYKRVGFLQPWIGYYAEENGSLVGAAGFKGPPADGSVEIAYRSFDQYQHRGFGTKICKELVRRALEADPTLKITARTLPEENYSVRILKKNNFIFIGTVNDPEDGDVWEWMFKARD